MIAIFNLYFPLANCEDAYTLDRAWNSAIQALAGIKGRVDQDTLMGVWAAASYDFELSDNDASALLDELENMLAVNGRLGYALKERNQ